VAVRSGDVTEVVLDKFAAPASVEGRVEDRRGVALGGASVGLFGPGGLISAETDASGRFRLDGIPVGRNWMSVVSASGFKDLERPLPVVHPGPNDIGTMVLDTEVTKK
jgi:hypothetical protein